MIFVIASAANWEAWASSTLTISKGFVIIFAECWEAWAPTLSSSSHLSLSFLTENPSIQLPNIEKPVLHLSSSSTYLPLRSIRQSRCRILRGLNSFSPSSFTVAVAVAEYWETYTIPILSLSSSTSLPVGEYWEAWTPSPPLPPHLYLFRVFANAVAEYWEACNTSLLFLHISTSSEYSTIQLPSIGRPELLLPLFFHISTYPEYSPMQLPNIKRPVVLF